jgi:pyruvate/2-oxoacid:ferredoxin oxidoreductase alpha subunit
MDGFITSHTQMVVDLPDQSQVDAYLPPCAVPHRLNHDHPATVGGLTWPRDTEQQRREIEEAMQRVPNVLAEAIDEFARVFGRRPAGAIECESTEDADTIIVASNTMAAAARQVVLERRARGERIGLVRIKQFRPFPREELTAAIGRAVRVGVLDRNHSPGSGGIFWSEVAATLDRPLVQNYIVGIGGGDVTPRVIDGIVDDLSARDLAARPRWVEVTA